ncbi:DUF6340 family protein [Aliifodinibius sp. S!AR15-10]|uniref:DUF6340 family protein n=1 Tax=Aliifodinibius sp. S!AR15-10 TaxID=2950437 RepID=UPI00285FDC2A|nr:DUF6340 family protein [Aliifodinibius sp. S!AR15-10]MDR8389557.1 DUF6340 family protein [Aliifodinibius sp. S!AR15-10]
MRYLTLSILAACLLFVGCSATDNLTMRVQEPAPVDLPPHMEKVGIINRTLTEDDSGVLETIDRIFSVKGAELDSVGAAAGINGLLNELAKNERVQVQLVEEADHLGNPSFGVFPAPLGWDRINKICSEHNLDGLFSLEFYDTDSGISYSTQQVTLKGPLGVEVPALEHYATVETTIKTGWRIYDNNGRNLIDEYAMGETAVTSGSGIDPTEAVKALTGRTEAVQTISSKLGMDYAQSILPYWVRVTREYFVKGNNNFEIAKRRAQTGNWEGAAELWLKETENPDTKIAGRAHYNMAIIEEIRGNLDKAIEWARTSYEDYGEKKALDYLRILQDRRARAEVLRRQQQ